jgi:membrane protein
MKTLNRIHEVEESRPLWKRYAIAVGLTLTAGTFLIGSMVLAVIGQSWGLEIASELGIEGAAATAFTWARWPVIIVLLLLAVAFVLWATPNADLPFRWISPGAVAFVVVWVPATALFSFYVANFGSYNATYGALGGTVVLLVWLYLTSFVLLLAAEINDILIEEKAPPPVKAEVGDAPVPEAESPPRRVASRAKGFLPQLALAMPVVVALLAQRRGRGGATQAR